jgi:hypothetical protein
VLLGGATLPELQSESELEYAPQGWFHDPLTQRGLLMVKLPPQPAAAGFTITLSSGPSFPHIGTEPCDTPTHHQVENQRFAWDAASGKFTSATGMGCLTVGKDKDAESHTPALEVQPCAAALNGVQQFTLKPSKQVALAADETQCLDQDVGDMRVIVYGCHDPGQPGNQAWVYDATTQHLISGENALCMCELPPAA